MGGIRDCGPRPGHPGRYGGTRLRAVSTRRCGQHPRRRPGARHRARHRRGAWRDAAGREPLRRRGELPDVAPGREAATAGRSCGGERVTSAEPIVLVVEDEPQVRRFLRASLVSRGYRLVEATTVREAQHLATSHVPDVFLLDLGLPDGDGIELTRALREWTQAPIIVLSARGREEDKVHALDAGADDYLTKPFGVNELLARMRVALRHAQAGVTPAPVLEFGELSIDRVRREVSRAGEPLHLTPTEYKLLVLLAQN